jgi:hypothetical protein
MTEYLVQRYMVSSDFNSKTFDNDNKLESGMNERAAKGWRVVSVVGIESPMATGTKNILVTFERERVQ